MAPGSNTQGLFLSLSPLCSPLLQLSSSCRKSTKSWKRPDSLSTVVSPLRKYLRRLLSQSSSSVPSEQSRHTCWSLDLYICRLPNTWEETPYQTQYFPKVNTFVSFLINHYFFSFLSWCGGCKCTKQNSDSRECEWPAAGLQCSDIHHCVRAVPMLPTHCSQQCLSMARNGRPIPGRHGATPMTGVGSRAHWWPCRIFHGHSHLGCFYLHFLPSLQLSKEFLQLLLHLLKLKSLHV